MWVNNKGLVGFTTSFMRAHILYAHAQSLIHNHLNKHREML